MPLVNDTYIYKITNHGSAQTRVYLKSVNICINMHGFTLFVLKSNLDGQMVRSVFIQLADTVMYIGYWVICVTHNQDLFGC